MRRGGSSVPWALGLPQHLLSSQGSLLEPWQLCAMLWESGLSLSLASFSLGFLSAGSQVSTPVPGLHAYKYFIITNYLVNYVLATFE